jgi:putative ABC transport system substrate-binding protein
MRSSEPSPIPAARRSVLMRRRVFVGQFIGTLLSGSVNALAQSGRVYRIATLGNEETPLWEGLRQGLRELGYVEGRDLRTEWRWSGSDPDRLPALARELVALEPDVLVTSGTQAALAAAAATRSIPIVMALSQHPEELGLVKSLARPGGNVTGLTTHSPPLTAKRLELLREVAPGARRIAALYSPDSESQRRQHADLIELAVALALTVRAVELHRVADLARDLDRIVGQEVDALLVTGNPITFRGRRTIADFALKHRMASMFEERLFVEAGGLMSYGPSFRDLFYRAAGYVHRILRGARPADLPVERPLRYELVVNRATASRLGLSLAPSTLLRVDSLVD